MNNNIPKTIHITAKMGVDTFIPAFFNPLSTMSAKILSLHCKRQVKTDKKLLVSLAKTAGSARFW